MKLTSMTIDAAGVGLCAALAAAVYFTSVVPSREAAEAAARDRTALCEEQKNIALLEASLLESHRQLTLLAGDAATEKSHARTSLDRISRISELAQDAGITLTELSPKPEQPGKKYNQSPLSLRGVGRMPGFVALVQALHREFPDTQIVNLTLTGNPEQRDSQQAMATELVWYTLAGGSKGAGPAGTVAQESADKP